MSNQFSFDVFLSHSSQDKAVVREVAERLKADGLRVWLDEWEIKPGDSIPSKIDDGLERSRVLVLCMSANAFGSDWAQLEAGTFRFRDPLNIERRFIPLRLDDTSIKDSLAQFSYINWLPDDREQGYAKLLESCRSIAKLAEMQAPAAGEQVAEMAIQLDHDTHVYCWAFSSDGKRALSGSNDNMVHLWDVQNGHHLRVLKGHKDLIWSVVWSADQSRALSCSKDKTIRLWDVETGRCLRVFKGHTDAVLSVVWSADHRHVLSSGGDTTLQLWDVETGSRLRQFDFNQIAAIWSVALNADGYRALSGDSDGAVRVWDVKSGQCERVLEGHTGSIMSIVWSSDGRRALSGGEDKTLRAWDVESGLCLRVLEGHTNSVLSVALSSDGRRALSGSYDKTVRMWDVDSGRCRCVLKGHSWGIMNVAWSADGRRVFSGDEMGGVRVWNLSEFITDKRQSETPAPDQVQYTNAKVLLVGNSSAGKTGLANRLTRDCYEETDSTVGAWATQWKLPVETKDGVEREIWLWDFGGQADQRLIHQLYMDQTHLAALVFDPQKEDLFDTLRGWDRDLTRAAAQGFRKLLIAGRIDAGGLRSVSRAKVEAFAKERGFARYLETSAKENVGCEEMKQAIIGLINWNDIAERTTPTLFKRLKEEIVRLKDEGRVLVRFNELRDALQLRLSGETVRFTEDELKAVISLLAGPGVVWELGFGYWILLQPEVINSHAQAVIRSLQEDEREIGCIAEEKVLMGDIAFPKAKSRLAVDDERIVLLAMHQILVERGLCLRDEDPDGKSPTMLIFPSYARRERPDLVEHPSVIVSYQFNGFLDDIYATLVVRLHHTQPFERDQLWRDAADFKTMTDRRLGVKLTRRADGAGELEVYFDPVIPVEDMMAFSKYVHEHLLKKAKDVVRLRHYVCRKCGTVVGNREVAMERLTERGKSATIICVKCEKRMRLWDELEKRFADPEVQRRVRELEEQSRATLDTESKERVLVGEVISTVALAGQLCREFSVSDHGIDMEIEFKNDEGEATGRKIYLQLKSGDSYLRTRKKDDAEIFTIKKPRHVKYWMGQAFPVLLVIRTSDGEVRWMEVRDWLKHASGNGKKLVKHITFEGERFDVMSVRSWRDKALDQNLP